MASMKGGTAVADQGFRRYANSKGGNGNRWFDYFFPSMTLLLKDPPLCRSATDDVSRWII